MTARRMDRSKATYALLLTLGFGGTVAGFVGQIVAARTGGSRFWVEMTVVSAVCLVACGALLGSVVWDRRTRVERITAAVVAEYLEASAQIGKKPGDNAERSGDWTEGAMSAGVELLRRAATLMRNDAGTTGPWRQAAFDVANWLDRHATSLALAEGDHSETDSPDDLSHAVTVARTYLGEAS